MPSVRAAEFLFLSMLAVFAVAVQPQQGSNIGRGGVVLDPFAGSGTAGVVAKRMGRGFVGCEIVPSYVEIAARRIAEVERNE